MESYRSAAAPRKIGDVAVRHDPVWRPKWRLPALAICTKKWGALQYDTESGYLSRSPIRRRAALADLALE